MAGIRHDKNFLSGLVLFAFSIALFKGSVDIPANERVFLLRANFFPLVLSTGMLICALIMMVMPLIKKNVETFNFGAGKKDILLLFAFIAMIFGYIYSLKFLGFLLGTFLYLVLSMLLLSVKDKCQGLIISLGVTVAIYLVFVKFLKVPFPPGLLSF